MNDKNLNIGIAIFGILGSALSVVLNAKKLVKAVNEESESESNANTQSEEV